MIKSIEARIFGTIDVSKMIISKCSENNDEIISIDNIGNIKLIKGDIIGIDLGEAKKVNSLELIGFCNIKDYLIEASIDNKCWEKVTLRNSIDFSKDVLAKYIRIRAIKDIDVELYGVEIYCVGNFKSNIEDYKTIEGKDFSEKYSAKKMKAIRRHNSREVINRYELKESLLNIINACNNDSSNLKSIRTENMVEQEDVKKNKGRNIKGRCNMS